tara:strand:- start:114 stop:950 length:837 start_codon:yes stop_codon:yes gene_type:complete
MIYLIKTSKFLLLKTKRFLKKIFFKLYYYFYKFKDINTYKKYDLPNLSTILSLLDISDVYSYMNGMFISKDLPKSIKHHRFYFSKEKRGFGEDSFHVLWYLLLDEFKPKEILEIGVYRGQVLTLWSLISKELEIKTNIFGLSPLKNIEDSVSSYIDIDYEKDIKLHCKEFNIGLPTIVKEYSNSKNGMDFIKSKKWDLIYIDGNHDYEVVKEDFFNSYYSLAQNGIIVMDDSSLYLNFKNRKGSFKGHPGPSRVCSEFARRKMLHIGTVGHNNIFQKL